MTFPFDDWQFWTVTLVAAGSLWALVKPFLPGDKSESAGGACPRCGVGAGAPCGREKSDTLVSLGSRRRSGPPDPAV